MPRNVTVTFDDGTQHVYQGVPETATPDQVGARAAQDFPGRQVKALDGGRGAAPPAPAQEPAGGADNFLNNRVANIAADVLGTPGDFGANVIDMAKAGTGALMGAGGAKPEKLPELIDRPNTMFTTEWFKKMARQLGLTTQAGEPTSAGGQALATILEAAGGAALGGASGAARGATTDLQAVKNLLKLGGQGAAAGTAVAGAQQGLAGQPEEVQAAGANAAALLPGAAGARIKAGAGNQVRRGLTRNADIAANRRGDEAAGIKVSDPAALTGSRALGMAEGTLARLPGGGSVMDKAAAERAKGIQGRVGELAEGVAPGGPPTKEAAGTQVQQGVRDLLQGARKKQQLLYSRVGVAPDKPVNLRNFAAELNRLGQRAKGMEAFSDVIVPRGVDRLRAAAADQQQNRGGQAPYEGAMQLRSQIGEMFEGGPVPEDGLSKAQYKSLYRALTQDVRESLSTAERARWEKANTFTRDFHDRVERVYEPLLDAKTPEKAVTAAFSGSKEGASSFRQIMGNLKPAQRKVVAAHVIDSMGRAPPGQQTAEGDLFSPQTFLTNWNKMHDDAKAALFPGRERADMQTIADAIGRLREAGRGTHNPSGTARAVTHAGFAGGVTTAVLDRLLSGAPGQAAVVAGGAGAQVLGTRALARSLTSPEFTRWLAEGEKTKPANVGAYLGRLQAIQHAQKDPDTAAAIEDVRAALGVGDSTGGQ
jgi:hypothetical protein